MHSLTIRPHNRFHSFHLYFISSLPFMFFKAFFNRFNEYDIETRIRLKSNRMYDIDKYVLQRKE